MRNFILCSIVSFEDDVIKVGACEGNTVDATPADGARFLGSARAATTDIKH